MPRAIALWTEAAELGSINAHFMLGLRLDEGEGVEEDKALAKHHYVIPAKDGHSRARHNLGASDHHAGRKGRAFKKMMISSKMGYEGLLHAIKDMFIVGDATKVDYAEALVGF